MIKIRQKIAIPFMIIIVLMPLITLLVFNVIMNAYVIKTSKSELSSAMETTNYLIKQLNQANKNEEEVISSLSKLSTALKTSKLATNVEIVILGKQGRLLYPKAIPETSMLSDNMLTSLKSFNFKNKQYQKLEVDNKQFLVYRNTSKKTNYKLIYIVSMENARSLIRVINLILIGIMAASTIIALVIAIFMARSISRPIKEITLATESIGKGEFVSIEPTKSSEEMNELYQNINNMSYSLLQAENVQKTFLQNASHELRTPLMSIQGYAEGIMNGIFADNSGAAKVISDESKRLTTLVEQLLILSRIDNKTYKPNVCRLDLVDIMKDYIQRINGVAIKQNKTILYRPEIEHLIVNVDEELISQAIMNIVSNGIRHTKETVEIVIVRNNSMAQITIRDDGNGIASQDLPHIFDRFYKGRGGNAGLGLSISKSAILFLGGEIYAQNGENGAEFIINLPVAK